jgi:hypothetical protein
MRNTFSFACDTMHGRYFSADKKSRGDGKPLREHIVWVVPFLDLLQPGVIIAKENFGGTLQAG